MQKVSKFLGLVAVVGFMLMAMVSGANAGTTGISLKVESAAANCAGTASITVTIDVGGFGVPIDIYLEVDGVNVGSEEVFIMEGVSTETINYTFPAQKGANVRFEFFAEYDFSGTAVGRGASSIVQSLAVIEKNCATGIVLNARPSDGRFCFAPGEARAALYSFRDENGQTGLEIWAVDANDKGERVIGMSAAEIDEATVEDEQTLLNSSIFNNIKFYRLADGRYQVNVGPAGEPKVHICIFDAIPPTRVQITTVEY